MARPQYDTFGKPIDYRAQDNRAQLYSDILRNVGGLPENALALGTGLATQAGTGLGTLAGMAHQKLAGDKINLDDAADTMGENVDRFTFQPRSEGGKATAEGLGTVMQPIDTGMQAVGTGAGKVAGAFGASPEAQAAVSTGVYTGLNFLDPELLAPGAAKIAALRGASRIARRGAETAVPMSEALRNVPKGQRGAYTLEDLAGTEGDFSFKSPTLGAFDRLKPQEQGRVSGVQLGKALKREGAKPEELTWMGLDDIINSNEMVEVADVRQIAAGNAPEFDFLTARSSGASDETIRDRARALAYESDELEYPVAVYRGSGRNRDFVETYDTQREADRAIEEMQASDHEAAKDDYLENIEQYIDDEEELAAMTENEKEEWAGQMANDREVETYGTENDYDNGANNLDEIEELIAEEIRRRPQDYGIEGAVPEHGDYTVGEAGAEDGSGYSVSAGRLKSEERFGKGKRGSYDTPSYLQPYMDEANSPVDTSSPQQSMVFTTTNGQQVGGPRSKAFQIEALRRKSRDADPNAGKFKEDVSLSHFDDLGENQLFFTRETDREPPAWGSVKKGVGMYEDSTLKSPNGALEESTGLHLPTRLIEEEQSDWLQRGRKTGFAEPKTIKKLEAEQIDENARTSAFQEQALSELPAALEDPRLRDFLALHEQRMQSYADANDAPSSAEKRLSQSLRDYERVRSGEGPQDMGARIAAAQNLFSNIYSATDSGSPAEAFARQINDGLERLPSMGKSPVKTVTPSAPMKDTRQYMQMAMADALRRAVQEGQQYLAWTPGDIHTKRWGTDSLAYAPHPENPRKFLWKSDPESARDDTGRPLDNLQASADELLALGPDAEGLKTIDLDDPNVDSVLDGLVRSKLHYGMHEYPNPDKQIAKRAAGLKKEMEALSKKAMAGERVAAHNSPRAYGFESAYGPMQEDLAAILRREGLELPEVRDIPSYGEEVVRGIELTPEIARAAKRGFKLPY